MGGSPSTSIALDSRHRFISAGWDLIDEIGIRDALATISVADVAQRAERSERTFWNHFETWSSFVEALVSNIPRRGPMEEAPDHEHGAVRVVDDALVGAARQVLPALVRAAAEGNWSEVTQFEELKAFRRQILLLSRAGSDDQLTEVLGRDDYGIYLPRLQRIYEETGASTRMQPVEPFDFDDLTRILAALSEGLLLQHMANPQRPVADFVVDATVAVALSLFTREEDPRSVQDIEAGVGSLDAALEPGPDMSSWAHACSELVERRRTEPLWAEVSAATGASQAELRASLHRLEVVGSLAFGQIVAAEREEVLRYTPGDRADTIRPASDLLSATDWLCRLVRSTRKHPWGATCLLRERLGPGADVATMRELVPLGAEFATLLGEERRSVHDRMINTALAAALSDNSASPAEVAHCATELHPALRSGNEAASSG